MKVVISQEEQAKLCRLTPQFTTTIREWPEDGPKPKTVQRVLSLIKEGYLGDNELLASILLAEEKQKRRDAEEVGLVNDTTIIKRYIRLKEFVSKRKIERKKALEER